MGINERLQAELGNDLHATCRVHWCGIDGDDAMRVPGEFELRAWQPEDLHGNAELEGAQPVIGQHGDQTRVREHWRKTTGDCRMRHCSDTGVLPTMGAPSTEE